MRAVGGSPPLSTRPRTCETLVQEIPLGMAFRTFAIFVSVALTSIQASAQNMDELRDSFQITAKNVKSDMPLRGWQGELSLVSREEVDRVTAIDDWKKLWDRSFGRMDTIPAIDFKREMVVAIFHGDTCSVGSLGLRAVVKSATAITIVYAYGESDSCGKPRTPFIFLVIPRNKKKLVVKAMWDIAMEHTPGPHVRVVKEFPSLK